MNPAQLVILKSEIDNDLASIGYASITTYKGLADALNASTQTSDRILTADIFDYLSSEKYNNDDVTAVPLIGRISYVASLAPGAVNPYITAGTLDLDHIIAARAMMELVGVESVPGASDGFQVTTTALGECRAVSIAQRNALRDLGANKTSRAAALLLPFVRGIDVEASGVVR